MKKLLLILMLISSMASAQLPECNTTITAVPISNGGGILVIINPIPAGAIGWTPQELSPNQRNMAITSLNPFTLTAWQFIFPSTTYTIRLNFKNANGDYFCKKDFTVTTSAQDNCTTPISLTAYYSPYTSKENFSWIGGYGATSTDLYINNFLMGSVVSPNEIELTLPNGTYQWYVIAHCPSGDKKSITANVTVTNIPLTTPKKGKKK